MFKQFKVVFSFGLMALSLIAGSASAEETGKSWAIKMFAQPKFDFGPVAQHSDCQGYLEFTNCFEPAMEVTSVSTSCRCITASTETKVLKPHESGKIKLVLDTSRFQGQRNVTLTVQFKYGNSLRHRQHSLCSFHPHRCLDAAQLRESRIHLRWCGW